ncbi:Uncharacterized protein OBRU01_18298 [Operophtera brumata]|uniref:Uncharacterized protein n=1 Tax=Operophtera brumata TaxID=104452 RepID=A0A0L7L1K2_OPEBR|nr:Uncharacterized protein OBRU01_18298 [Operophtera brumata]
MLKAGEFSPNNPLVRGDRVSGICGDAMLGLGELLEQAEMRRLEEQLRIELQRDIDNETQKLRISSHPTRNLPKRHTNTSKSDSLNLPFHYPNEKSFQPIEKKPYSFNIPDNSIFSANYDVDSYLRKNLNFKNKNGVEIFNNNDRNEIHTKDQSNNERITDRAETNESRNADRNETEARKFVIEKALIHEPKEKPSTALCDVDSLSVPVLRHSPKRQAEPDGTTSQLSDAMKKVDDKWKVPAVQKNILKSLPNEDGKNISILTQLGSIRRQLQLEQLKLDKMLNKNDS